MIALVGTLVYAVVWLLFVALFIAMAVNWLQVFSPEWRARGVLAVVFEAVFSATDPLIKLCRRIIPASWQRAVPIDLGFTLAFLIVVILLQILAPLAS